MDKVVMSQVEYEGFKDGMKDIKSNGRFDELGFLDYFLSLVEVRDDDIEEKEDDNPDREPSDDFERG